MQQPYAFAPPPEKKSNTIAIVLIVVGVLLFLGVAVIVALGLMAWAGARQYVAVAKAAEARNTVSEIAMDAQTAYEREDLDPKTGALVTHRLCPSASHPVPSTISEVRGKKYMSSPTDWSDDSAKNAGFFCLKFEMLAPQYYQYDYRTSGTGAKLGDSFTVEAKGDLDGDGRTSSFSVMGTVGAGDTITTGPTKEADPGE